MERIILSENHYVPKFIIREKMKAIVIPVDPPKRYPTSRNRIIITVIKNTVLSIFIFCLRIKAIS